MWNEPPTTDELVRAYLSAKREVIERGFDGEIAWQARMDARDVTCQSFVRESAWVILCAGMREAVIRSRFAELAYVFHDFDPASMVQKASTMRPAALGVFGHERKIEAILAVAEIVDGLGLAGLRKSLEDVEGFLVSLPYVGPITWRHLAKNLGYSVAKADRHLARLATAWNRESVDILCSEISCWLGEPVPVVDVVLWRWSVLHRDSCRTRCEPGAPCFALTSP